MYVKKVEESIVLGQDEYIKFWVPVQWELTEMFKTKYCKGEVTKIKQLDCLSTQTRPNSEAEKIDGIKQKSINLLKRLTAKSWLFLFWLTLKK